MPPGYPLGKGLGTFLLYGVAHRSAASGVIGHFGEDCFSEIWQKISFDHLTTFIYFISSILDKYYVYPK